MNAPLTWEACAAAGMSKSQAARAMGHLPTAASDYARRHGLSFREGRAERTAPKPVTLPPPPWEAFDLRGAG